MNWVKHPIYNVYINEPGQVLGARGNLRKPRKDRYGYLRINLAVKGQKKNKTAYIHRLMAECFELPGSGETVDHIDGNKENNSVENLQLVTALENYRLYLERGKYHKGYSPVEINGVLYRSKREAERETGTNRRTYAA
jgi:hypothetical protein